MDKETRLSGSAFSNSLQVLLRFSGYTQKELAEKIGLHPKVLSRKLNGNGNAHLTHLEVRSILIELTRWHAITTQDEAFQLLALAEVGPNLFDEKEWHSPPLNQLNAKSSASHVSNGSPISTQTFQDNLPAPTTRFIGREWAVKRLRQLFGRGDVRLVTLVGSGGSGKTFLAQHIARELVGTFEQGVWFVPLAGISSPAQVSMSIIQALDIQTAPAVSPLQTLCTYLRNKLLLLVLDNFEHVREAANTVDELLAAAPGLKVLVTSRTRLHIYGEHILGVPPLDIPRPNVVLKTTELVHYEAIQLFVERAQAVVNDFELTDENKATLVQICAKVDGLPLALELAAARVRVLSPALLLEKLSNAPLSILTGGAKNLSGRQQTLRNTIAWSYNLLSFSEQTWFSRLGIFSGGWSLEAAEAMMQRAIADSNVMLDIIEQLVDNSLLVRYQSGDEQLRFSMLETLREYALEQLTARQEAECWRDWHACYFLKIAETAELGLRGPQQLMWLKRLVADHDNFRAALTWLLQRARAGMSVNALPSLKYGEDGEHWDVAGSKTLSRQVAPWTDRSALELCLRLASALRHSLEWQGYLIEGREWLYAAIAIPWKANGEEALLAARAKALSETSRLLCLQDEQAKAIELAEQSIALWRQLDDPSGLATALLHRGWPAHVMSDYEGATRFYGEGLHALAETDELWLRAQLLCYLGATAGFTFEFVRMQSYYQQSTELFEQVGDKSAVADLLKDQGGMLILESNYAESIVCLLRSIDLCRELGHKQYIATGMGWLAIAVGMRGKPDLATASLHAATLQGATDGLMETIGLTPWARTHPMVQTVFQHIRSQVDEQSWEDAWRAGEALALEQAIELAHQVGEGSV